MLASLGEKPNGGTTMEKVDTAAIAAPVGRNAFGPAASKLLNLPPFIPACTGNVLWGFSFLFTRMALQAASPEILLSVRFVTAFLFMNLLILLGKGRVSLRGKNLKPLIVLGLLEPVYFFFESYGILYTNATLAGVILAATPVVSIVLAAVFLKEYPLRRQVLFCLFPVAGVIVITVCGSSMGIASALGLVLLFCTCLISATSKTLNRRVSRDYSPFERTYMGLLAGSVVFTLSAFRSVGGDFGKYFDLALQPRVLGPALVLGVFCSIVAGIMVNYAAGKMPVVKLTTFGAISTVCSTFAGVLFLGEPLSAALFAGSFLIVVGIWQVTRI